MNRVTFCNINSCEHMIHTMTMKIRARVGELTEEQKVTTFGCIDKALEGVNKYNKAIGHRATSLVGEPEI